MIFQDNKIIKIIENPGSIKKEIAPGNYLVKFDQINHSFFLESIDAFELPSKIYGDYDELSKRYLNTFKNKNNNLGILLKGLKGTGKSLLAKKICIDSNLPVLIISTNYSGPAFESFLESIKQECIIFIDEFEKIYNSGGKTDLKGKGTQADLLSILDGTFTSKKLFIFTANENLKIANAMLNRPGRIYYLKEFNNLDDTIISRVIDDNLKDLSKKEDLLKVLFITGNINMDLLITLIEEMNRYNETAREAVFHLNIRPENDKYEVTWTIDVDIFNLENEFLRKDKLEVEATLRDNIFSTDNVYISGIITNSHSKVKQQERWKYSEIQDDREDSYNYKEVNLDLKLCNTVINNKNNTVTITTETNKPFKFKRMKSYYKRSVY